MAVFGWFVHYVLIMVILAAVAVAGVFAGRKWAEKSKAKKDTAASGNAGKELCRRDPAKRQGMK